MRRIYISGPMTGYEEFNFPAFRAAAARWRDLGWFVIDPSQNPHQPTRADYMRLDIAHLMVCAAIAMLPGWESSEGALTELRVARELDLEVFDAVTCLPVDWGVIALPGVESEP